MTAAVMQPYLFPYLGYYQLVNAVDTFVFFDDVNFINKGWINRNNILQQDKPLRFTVPLLKASQNKLINEIELADYHKWRKEFLKTIEMSYKKAPHYSIIFNWLGEFFEKNFTHISQMAAESVSSIASLLQFSTDFKLSSSLKYTENVNQSGQSKVLNICSLLNAETYINPKNGTELYDNELFIKRGIMLHFIQMDNIVYRQLKNDPFVPNLSIIDVLMFNGLEETKSLLKQCSLN